MTLVKLKTIKKCIIFDACQLLGSVTLVRLIQLPNAAAPMLVNTVWNYNIRQAGATKSSASDIIDAVWNNDLGQAYATIECRVTDACDRQATNRVGDCHRAADTSRIR